MVKVAGCPSQQVDLLHEQPEVETISLAHSQVPRPSQAAEVLHLKKIYGDPPQRRATLTRMASLWWLRMKRRVYHWNKKIIRKIPLHLQAIREICWNLFRHLRSLSHQLKS